MSRQLVSLGLLAGVWLTASGCGGDGVMSSESTLHETAQAVVSQQPMLVYRYGQVVHEAELKPLGPPVDFGGTVVSGSPRFTGRVDYDKDRWLAGIFQVTTGSIRARLPHGIHATVLAGTVTVVDRTVKAGTSYTLGVGDTFFIEQGTSIQWTVEVPRVQLSFFLHSGTVRSSGRSQPITVYRYGQTVADSELRPVEHPLLMGGVPSEGSPQLSTRVDYEHVDVEYNLGYAEYEYNKQQAGIFQSTTGRVLVRMPFTEHMTVLDGEVTITDIVHGITHTFRPGDSYVIQQGTLIDWNVRGARLQKTYFNFTGTPGPLPAAPTL